MHAATVPVEATQWFAMPVYSNPVLFTDSFKQITGYPHFISSPFCALGKNLELPLPGCHFCIDSLNIQPSFQACVKMFLNYRTAISILGTYRAIIAVSYTHLRAHETPEHLVCRLLLEKK